MKKVKPFKEWKKKRKSDGSLQRINKIAQDAMRDQWTDSYRSQSAKREADVHH